MPFPYRLIGCHPNRDTLREIEASPLAVESVRRGELPRAPKIERPMIVGLPAGQAPSELVTGQASRRRAAACHGAGSPGS